jgi:hypothetical protein
MIARSSAMLSELLTASLSKDIEPFLRSVSTDQAVWENTVFFSKLILSIVEK